MAIQADNSADTAQPSTWAPKTPAQPITNFPIPRELRDEIYAYLLNAERVEEVAETCEITEMGTIAGFSGYKEYEGPRTSYRFSTSILTVNKAIGAEATAHLYSKNCFVRVRYECAAFDMLRTMAELPIVAHVSNTPFQHHCFTLDLQWDYFPKWAAHVVNTLPPYDADAQRGDVLVSLHRFSKFCDLVRFLCGTGLPPSLLATTGRDEKLQLLDLTHGGQSIALCEKDRQLSFRLNAHGSKFRPCRLADQKVLLEGLRTVTGAGYGISFTGFTNSEMVLDITASMAPSLIFPVAFLSSFVELLHQMKDNADALAKSGMMIPAYKRYDALGVWQRMCFRGIQELYDENLSRDASESTSVVNKLLNHFIIDLACSSVAMALFHGYGYAADVGLKIDLLKEMQGDFTPQMHSLFGHLIVLAHLSHCAHKELTEMEERLIHFEALLKQSEYPDEWMEHDLDIIRAALKAVKRGISIDEAMAFGDDADCEPDESVPESDEEDGDEEDDDDEYEYGDDKGEGEGEGEGEDDDEEREGEGPDEEYAAEDDSSNKVRPMVSDLLAKLSIWTMPFRVYDSRDDPTLPPADGPEDYNGWVDIAHMKALSEEDKARAHKSQKSLGLTLSKFE